MSRTFKHVRALLVATVCLVAGPALALTGTVVDPDGKAVEGATVCYLLGDTEGICASTDKRGYFQLPTSAIDRIQIRAKGFLPRVVASVTPSAPIPLERAGGLWIKPVGPDGTPVSAGEAFVVLPNGVRKGPFPFNDKGVRIKTLPVASYRVIVHAEGWDQPRSIPIDLVAGKETTVEVPMTRAE